jgi:H+/Cl- antiporter ClcA
MRLRTRRRLGIASVAVAIAAPIISDGLRSQPAYVCTYAKLAGNPCPPTGPAPAAWVIAVVLAIIGIAMLAPWWLHWFTGTPPPRDPDKDMT